MDYLVELKKLPQKIQDILISPFGSVINKQIIDKYNLGKAERQKLIDMVNDLYLKKLASNDLYKRIKEEHILEGREAKKMAVDIMGLKLLIANDYFGGVIENFIRDLGGNPGAYGKIVAQEKEAIKREIEEYNEKEEEFIDDKREKMEKKLNPKHPSPPKEEDEKEETLFTFKEKLSVLLSNKSQKINELIEFLNEDLIDWILSDKEFAKNLENSLYGNQEKITHKHFVLDGKPHAPSVRNWIRDFVKKHGTGMFNNVVLTDYVTNSENGKKLDAGEKKLVAKLLLLYRNLKFFPESMKGVPVEKWEIIPVDRSGNEEDRIGKISGPPRTEEEKRIDELETEEKKYVHGGLEERVIEEEIGREKRLEELHIEANKYPAGSLERRAIEEEIRNLGN